MPGKPSHKLQQLKSLIVRLHRGESSDRLREEFKEALRGVSPAEVAQVEEELIREGLPREEVQKLCDVHIAVFRESLEKEPTLAPAGHPIHILMEEHKLVLRFASEFVDTAQRLKKARDFDSAGSAIEEVRQSVTNFKDSASHYLREENVLFPYLEKHGITQPPAVMWAEHDKIRAIEKGFYKTVDAHSSMSFAEFTRQLEESALALADMLSQHFYKENHILFPTALRVIGEHEWPDIRAHFDELGYCCFTPEAAKTVSEVSTVPVFKREREDMLSFATGHLFPEEIGAIFSTLPVDITFVDKDDTVRYYSDSKERIFVRSPAVVGRKVQNCHPEKSLHLVNKILEDFRSGKKDVAEFWIHLNDRLIHIRYFAVREKGDYLGCVEVTQDITDIQKIEGEKKLL
jgi:DUF438 domain-containing protein